MNEILNGPGGKGVYIEILTTDPQDTNRYDNSDIILRVGEPFYDRISGKLFVGDGVTAIKNLVPIGLQFTQNIGQTYTATHTISGTTHVFTIQQALPSNQQYFVPVITRYIQKYSAGNNILIVINGVTYNVTARMTNNKTMVTDTFCQNTVGMFYLYFDNNNYSVYFPSATAVWAE